MEKILTGYPSIDKPQEKYYRQRPIREFDVNQTLHDLIVTSNVHNMWNDAIGYFGNNIKYDILLKKLVNKAASAYLGAGVKAGDVVLLGVINTPEAAVNLLALNKIGAVSKWIDIRASQEQIRHYVNEHNCKVIVIHEGLIKEVESVISETDLKKVLVVSPFDSLPSEKKFLLGAKNIIGGAKKYFPSDSRFQKYSEFIASGNEKETFGKISFDKERPSVIIQSSGTTGIAKSIVHSDYSFTSFVDKVSYSDVPLYRGKKLLTLVPPWVAYGLVNSLYVALAFGMQAQIYPKFDPDAIVKNKGKFNMCFAAPFHYFEAADRSDEFSEKDKKMMECIISGGDKITIEQLEYVKDKLGVRLINGYGNNEGLGAVTFNPQTANKFGTIGIPKRGDIVSVFDENCNELKYGEVGEICYKSETAFIEYFNNPEETARVKRKHSDGSYWVHTGDLGFVDEDGYITYSGRATRVIARLGFKLSPLYIENAISKHEAVDKCITVGVDDKADGQVPYTFITLKPEYLGLEDKILAEIEQHCTMHLKDNELPKYYKVIPAMPITDNNKYDFKSLEKLAIEDINSSSHNIQMKKTLKS